MMGQKEESEEAVAIEAVIMIIVRRREIEVIGGKMVPEKEISVYRMATIIARLIIKEEEEVGEGKEEVVEVEAVASPMAKAKETTEMIRMTVITAINMMLGIIINGRSKARSMKKTKML